MWSLIMGSVTSSEEEGEVDQSSPAHQSDPAHQSSPAHLSPNALQKDGE
jgi:hypothetical protein